MCLNERGGPGAVKGGGSRVSVLDCGVVGSVYVGKEASSEGRRM